MGNLRKIKKAMFAAKGVRKNSLFRATKPIYDSTGKVIGQKQVPTLHKMKIQIEKT
jgi:hypothetical protein